MYLIYSMYIFWNQINNVPAYQHNGFVATHALGHMMQFVHKCTLCAQVHELPQSHRGDNRDIVFIIVDVLRPSCFCEIWALCVHLYIYIQNN